MLREQKLNHKHMTARGSRIDKGVIASLINAVVFYSWTSESHV